MGEAKTKIDLNEALAKAGYLFRAAVEFAETQPDRNDVQALELINVALRFARDLGFTIEGEQ